MEQSIKPATQTKSPSSQAAKMLIELGPLIVFFVVNARSELFWGTGAFMAATVVSLIASKMIFGKVPVMPLISGLFVLLFGGLTLWLQDELFIKMKPTVVNAIFSAILLGGLMFGHALLKYPFGEAFELTERGWRLLTLRWGLFFIFLAVLNEAVWRFFSTDFWVAFKVWGVMPITFLFAMTQLSVITRHSQDSGS